MEEKKVSRLSLLLSVSHFDGLLFVCVSSQIALSSLNCYRNISNIAF